MVFGILYGSKIKSKSEHMNLASLDRKNHREKKKTRKLDKNVELTKKAKNNPNM
jgi:hypothetical protein